MRMRLVKAFLDKIHMGASVKPHFCKPRTVPYALKEKVYLELDRLEHADMINPVQFADWAAPIIPVIKRDGTLHVW